LHFAAFTGKLVSAKILVQYGADIQAISNANLNMMHLAAQGGHAALLHYFWTQKIDIDA